MDRDSYTGEVLRQLNNTNYYKKLTEPIYLTNVPKIRMILNKLKYEGYICSKQFDFLLGPTVPRPRIFYILPKIHKPPEKWPHPSKMPEGRPIISNVESETYHISQYIDSFVNPLAMKHDSYLKNTYDFINKIRNKNISKEAFIVTADVSALYTNMDHTRTINCVRETFLKYPDPKRPDRHLLDLLHIALTNNDFQFDGKFFLQTCGTPMGFSAAVGLANLYLLEFDEKAKNGFKIPPIYYFRYIDDVFFIWVGNEKSLLEFRDFLNTLIPGISITFEYSKCSANFLDTTVFKHTEENGFHTLQTKVFFKPTDTHQLLHTDSFHPKHTTKGILKSQLIRFKRISSFWEDYVITCKILFSILKFRGYSWSKMWSEMKEIWYDYTEKPASSNHNPILPIIVPHNKLGSKLGREFRKIISSNPQFNKHKCILAFKTAKNLRKALVKSEFK